MSLLGLNTFFLFLFDTRTVVYKSSFALLGRKSKKIKNFSHESGESLSVRLQQVRKAVKPKKDDLWYLGLPSGYFSLTGFNLPKAAAENLDQAVRFGLMRHIAYDLDTAYTHYLPEERGDSYLIKAVAAQKRHVQEILETVSATGIPLSGIFPSLALLAWIQDEDGLYIFASRQEIDALVRHDGMESFHAWEKLNLETETLEQHLSRVASFAANATSLPDKLHVLESPLDNSALQVPFQAIEVTDLDWERLVPHISKSFKHFPYQINLLPASLQKRKKIFFYIQAAVLFFAVLGAMSYPLAQYLGHRTALTNLDERIQSLRVQAERLQEVRQENRKIQDFLAEIANFRKIQPNLSEVLKELTEILPMDTWLQKFNFSKGWILIEGYADSATQVIEALENSPLFSQADFESAVTKRRFQEYFRIKAKWK